jgi:cytochrome bd ubiquinol oxidase subunit II
VFGVASLVLLALRRYLLVRLTSALAVTAIIWGWAAAQYPYMLPPDVDYTAAQATHAVLVATLVVTGIGALVLLPSLAWLLVLFQRGGRAEPTVHRAHGSTVDVP